MASFRTLPRKPWTVALVLAITWMLFPGSAFGQQPRDSSKSFGSARNREERRSLLQAWKAQRKASPGTKTGQSITGGAPPPYVGRASMVINTAGTIVYTKNFLGAGATCDPDIESNNNWFPNTAFAAGAVVRPIGFGPSGANGFNFQANNAGTSGATEPAWPTSGVGATVNDNGIVWTAIGFDPADFVGCIPIQLVSRASGGAETVIAEEGDTLPDGSQLAGWSEFIAMNASGTAAFRAAMAGFFMNDGDDEGGSGIFTAGPGAGALTRIAATSTTIAGRAVCGFSAMVGMNNAGQVVFDTYEGVILGNNCDENNHGIVRFTPGPGNELLVEQGSTVGTPSATVIGFGSDDNSAPPCGSGTCDYESIEGFINSTGHVSVVLNLSDGTQGVYNFSGPGVATQVARSGAGLTAIGARTSLNNADQVVYRATSGGVDTLFRFTPPATTTTIASVGQVVNGNTISSLGPYSDINNGGNVVFGGKVNGDTLDAYYFWNGATVTQVATGPVDTFASEMITINDANQVAYVTGMTTGPDETDGPSEDYETGGIFLWTLAGGSSNLISVGDTINGEVVTTFYAQHTSFARRQFSQAGCLATVYMVFNDDPGIDCSEGGTLFCSTPYVRGGQLFASCAVGGCPTITVLPTTLPNGTPGVPYSQTITATGGVAPYTFAVTAGTLPPGLTLTPAGLLSGTPTTNGSFPFTVTATDSGGICTGARAYTINVAAVTIVITPPVRNIFVGTTATLTVTISVAQATDTIVTLLSSNPAIASVPPSVTILAGQLSATFIVTGVALGGPVTITASLPPSFQAPPATASVTVIPVPVAEIPTLGGWAMGLLVVLLAAAALLVMRR